MSEQEFKRMEIQFMEAQYPEIFKAIRNRALDEAMETINNVGLPADDNAAVIIAIKALKGDV